MLKLSFMLAFFTIRNDLLHDEGELDSSLTATKHQLNMGRPNHDSTSSEDLVHDLES